MLQKNHKYEHRGGKKIEKKENQPLKGRDGKDESKMLESYGQAKTVGKLMVCEKRIENKSCRFWKGIL